MDILITPVAPMDHEAVKIAAARFFSHIEKCSLCDLRARRLCDVGTRLREEKARAVARKWRR